MTPDRSLPRLTVSYHTAGEEEYLLELVAALGSHQLHLERLDYLTLRGFSTPEGLGGGTQRLDAWIENFLSLLESSVGVLVVQSSDSHTSETVPGRGMWIERQLLGHLSEPLTQVTRFLQLPQPVRSTSTLLPTSWANAIAEEVAEWAHDRFRQGKFISLPSLSVQRMERQGHPVKLGTATCVQRTHLVPYFSARPL